MDTTLTVAAAVGQAAEVATWAGPAVGVCLAFAFGPRLLRLAVRMIKGR